MLTRHRNIHRNRQLAMLRKKNVDTGVTPAVESVNMKRSVGLTGGISFIVGTVIGKIRTVISNRNSLLLNILLTYMSHSINTYASLKCILLSITQG